MEFDYIIKSEGEEFPVDAKRFESEGDAICDPEGLAIDAAWQHYRQGGFVGWPIDLEIYADGTSLGIYHVEKIDEPQFFAVPCTPESYA